MSSPARSSASQPQVVGPGPAAVLGDDNSLIHFPTDLISAQDRKEEALVVLKSNVMAVLQKEVKSLDEDSWKFAGPRSKIHLISRPAQEDMRTDNQRLKGSL
ncbi:protein SAMBA isoform X2 [Magnolia sinica]|uniref:protein SAMBA isoform X2 n=1 Tax=Magnolia sinica TaxID=86752 RepID=UPI002657F173|nr:protein SAMBA isoform X2 [Magnolia sinica]XP_058086340.1 protein SAMBA isoform X2 [Magnolia sinica]